MTSGVLADPFISSDQLSSKGISVLLQEEADHRNMDHRKLLHLFRLLLVYWQASSLVLCGVRHPVPVLWMMPVSSGPDAENMTDAVAPAVRQALKDLQRQPPPLGNYEIQLQLLYAQVGSGSDTVRIFKSS